jgi:hypothetical protein
MNLLDELDDTDGNKSAHIDAMSVGALAHIDDISEDNREVDDILCQLEKYFLPFRVGLYSVVHLFLIDLSYYSGLVY